MTAYHFDLLGNLPVGKLKLETNFMGFDKAFQVFCADLFPEGLSMFGLAYTEKCLTNSPMAVVYFTETIFETVRRQWFPEKPSRFQSIFGVKSIESARDWGEKLKKNLSEEAAASKSIIRLIQFERFFSADSFWRDNYEQDSLDFVSVYANATAYWSGKLSNCPQLELVIPLPVIVLPDGVT